MISTSAMTSVAQEKGNDCKCVKHIHKRVALASCGDDRDAVAALPDDWTPKRSSSILTNYLRQREVNHEKVLDDIAQDVHKINEDINLKVRERAEKLLDYIKQNQLDIKCVVRDSDQDKEPLHAEARNNALARIHKLYSSRIDDVTTFKCEALALERERADGIKILLREHFQRLIAVGHKNSKDLLHYIDQMMYEINQQLLCNSRAYADLEAKLRIQADESVVHARSSLNQLYFTPRVSSRSRSANVHIKDRKDSQLRSHSVDRPQDVRPSVDILDSAEEFDAIVNHLLQAYRTAVLNVFTGFSSKLTELENNLFDSQNIVQCNDSEENKIPELQHMIERILCRLSSTVNKKYKSLIEINGGEILTMQKSLFSLGQCLQDTYKILHNAGHLWDAHILRSALVQKLTIAAVEDLSTNNDTMEQGFEVPYSIALEQMRCCPEVNKLQTLFDSLLVMLDRTADMYLTHSRAEVARLEEFLAFSTVMANTLQSEFELFLQNHPRPPTSMSDRSSQHNFGPERVYCPKMSLPRAILQSELQETALKNWRNGFLESFKTNVFLVPEELRHQAQLWVDERSTALNMRYTLKMASHSIRAERLKAARDARLAELLYHDDRLKSHLAAVYNLIALLPLEASEYASLDAPFLYPLCEWKDRIQMGVDALVANDSVDLEVKKLKMSSYARRLPKHRKLFEESLDAALMQYKKMMEYHVQEARVSNVRFAAQIKLFSEGGRYGAQEALKTSAALIICADALEGCLVKAIAAIDRRRVQLLAIADAELTPLQRFIETGATGIKGDSGQKKKK